MGILDYINLGEAKFKVVFSSSTKSSSFSTTGQLGFYNTKAEALADIKNRLPNTLFLDSCGHAILYRKKITSGRLAKWEKIGTYTLKKQKKQETVISECFVRDLKQIYD